MYLTEKAFSVSKASFILPYYSKKFFWWGPSKPTRVKKYMGYMGQNSAFLTQLSNTYILGIL